MEKIFAAAITGLVLDIILSATWDSTYFRFGVPAYAKSYRLRSENLDDLTANINKDDNHTLWARFKIKKINKGTYYLRKNLWYFGFNHLMPFVHWRISVNENGQYLNLKAFYQMYSLMLLLGIGMESILAFGVISLVFIIFYAVSMRFNFEPGHEKDVEDICELLRS